MKNVEPDETLYNNDFLDNTFTSLDLNADIKEMYDSINNQKLQNDFEQQVELTHLRDENYRRYNEINIIKYRNLPSEFDDVKHEILNLYNYIDIKKILTDNYQDSKNNGIILSNIYVRIHRLDNMVISYLKELTIENDKKQEKFSRSYFNSLDISDKLKKELIEKYNDLVLHASSLSKDVYKELEIQYKRKEYINEILKLLNLGKEEKSKLLTQDRLQPINLVINMEIDKYKDKIQYLEDLMLENSIYIKEFDEFKTLFNKLIAYDDTNYENARQIFDILVNDQNLKNKISNFESLFISERENKLKEYDFIKEKVGIKNLINSLTYISVNYLEKLSIEDINTLKYIQNKIDSNEYDINELKGYLSPIVKKIWKEQITDIYNYNPAKDYYFICSNNQFIDEKYQTILISNKEIEKVNNYEDYQIGFICNYNDN